jgi:ABC-2 type transport system ATP-binding protein
MINDPKVLFLDEPTSGLDVEVAMEVRNYVKNLVETTDTTVILTSHILHEVEEMCKEIAIINEGKLVTSGNVSSIRKNFNFPDIAYFYLDRYDKIDFLRKVPGVIEHSVSEDGLFVKMKSSPATVKKIMSELDRSRTKILDLEIRKATLEEVFMKIVGRSMRRDPDV